MRTGEWPPDAGAYLVLITYLLQFFTCFQYKFQSLYEEDLTSAVRSFCAIYNKDVSEDLVE